MDHARATVPWQNGDHADIQNDHTKSFAQSTDRVSATSLDGAHSEGNIREES